MSLTPNTTLTIMLFETREETKSNSLPSLPLVGDTVWLPLVVVWLPPLVVRGVVVACVVGWVVGGGVCGGEVWMIGGGVCGEEVVESCECVVVTMCWVVRGSWVVECEWVEGGGLVVGLEGGGGI